MQVELKRIQQEVGISFVYVTHDQEEALAMSDRLAVMHDGKVQQVGTPKQVYDEPASAFVADFVGHSNLLDCEVVSTHGDGCRVQLGAGQQVEVPGLDARPGRGRLMVRPEDVVLTPKDDARPHGVTGQVVSQMFLGSADRIEVALPDASRVVCVRDRRSAEVRVGDWVGVEWGGRTPRFFPGAS
jgi:spermidine/putrescine transport system ATP-binding protein